MIQLQYPLILASSSPRRQELLTKLEIPFKVQNVNVDEIIPEDVKPREAALYLANLKGEAHDFLAKHHIIITADTTVILANKILDKPSSAKEAKSILGQLSNNTHEVITGVSIRANNEVYSFDVSTKVTFGALSKKEIAYYVNSGNANDKAGAYGIQDWIGLVGISSIEGSYYNVMGLPTLEVYSCLKKYFIKPLI
ncbi:MAG: Maf family nucleotide pyrophosphatase [Cyclobacteriaceae bacterium]|nr:Maf family nucleotide pyrophosphatase [Cyclobacteriaceae bacterium]